jgi:hypothetical protein
MSRPMSDDDLRARLARLDPAGASAAVDPVTSPRAADRLERIVTRDDTLDPPTTHARPRIRRPRRTVLAAAAVGMAAAATAGALLLSGDSPGAEPTTLALDLPPSSAMGSCMVFDPAFLTDVPVAFGGTVSVVEADSVVLDVDRWYTGGDADVVRLDVPDEQSSASLDGVDFRAGERYLVTASSEGMVNGCGLSGPATPELQRAFDSAFPG